MSKGSDLLVAALANEGVNRVFRVPGEENLDVVARMRALRVRDSPISAWRCMPPIASTRLP
jgi:thiamine pyrophosphate-dependent acetolactate synthase large subunit-like protein